MTEQVRDLETVEVEITWQDSNGIPRSEILRFTGREIDSFESGQSIVSLYECPGGYRIHVDDQRSEEQTLYPHEPNPRTGELDYTLYSAEEVAEQVPAFGQAVGVLRVRDID